MLSLGTSLAGIVDRHHGGDPGGPTGFHVVFAEPGSEVHDAAALFEIEFAVIVQQPL